MFEVVDFVKEINKTRVKKGGKSHAGWFEPEQATHIIIHHTATNSYNISENPRKQILNYSEYHAARNNGFSRAIQYSFFIPKDGGGAEKEIFQCLDLRERTFHCHNDSIAMHSVSVVIDGNYNIMEFSDRQKRKLEYVIDWIQDRTGGKKIMSWHKAVGTVATDCPGKNIIKYLGKYLNGFRLGYSDPAEGHYFKRESGKFVQVTDRDINGKILRITQQEIKPLGEKILELEGKANQTKNEVLDLRKVVIENDRQTKWLDKVYLEVLHRYADGEGWKAYRYLDEDAVRQILLKSEEKKALEAFKEKHPLKVGQLDDLYLKLFFRRSDLAGRRHFVEEVFQNRELDLEAIEKAIKGERGGEYDTKANGRLANNPMYEKNN